ncbi:lipoprotein [Yersinia enterocolitica]|uniref:Lipoprotein n=1 Tax=Yersinia enterocolitica serotype O:8 / biotype 1B (strain NCTC 13174 / 8081) TaxID=393305 RepID=A1JM90_YERE8|nr:lipoprotein [Yersinia enterocolitica]AJJ23492.1 putative lipoprotein YbjP [Yersinia enterocolitica]CAL11582.1 putative lipoprotein [Yersinia enterocolitica subsp. enterocolitica 8081]HDL8282742.1 lipoprotein [Yersinia enterocolitica]HDM8290151.1 lipoprotein [Yersinia enterocolitica]HDM8294396.1 lipoprotein [Yersinia enterocolitica]
MKKKNIALILPLAILLSACSNTVDPAYKDISSRTAPCIDGGPDTVAQKFYDLRVQQIGNKSGLPDDNLSAQFRPYLSQALYEQIQTARKQAGNRTSSGVNSAQTINGDIFSSLREGSTSADVASASTIPNTDARNIPLRVNLTHQSAGGQSVMWQDEVLMIREGTCWVVDDIRFMGVSAPAGSLRQLLGDR